MPAKSKHENISTIPRAERELVVVMPDETVEALRKVEASKLDKSNKSIELSGVNENAKLMLRSLRPYIRPSMNMSVAMGLVRGAFAVVSLAEEASSAWERVKANGVDSLQIKASEASQLTFPSGHPKAKVLYAAHPIDSNVYYPVASYHRMVFEHKFAEAINLLMHLGATKITVEHVRGWSTEFAASLSARMPSGPVSAKGASTAESKATLLFEASLPGNTSRELPENLVWHPHEPTWAPVVNGRLRFGLKEFSLTVNYEDDHGINGSLNAAATKAGLELGGKFENHVATSWQLVGTFASES